MYGELREWAVGVWSMGEYRVLSVLLGHVQFWSVLIRSEVVECFVCLMKVLSRFVHYGMLSSDGHNTG